jgi:hypothetical protein
MAFRTTTEDRLSMCDEASPLPGMLATLDRRRPAKIDGARG